MKKFFLILLLIISCATASTDKPSANIGAEDNLVQKMWQKDKLDHMVYSAYIYKVLQDQGMQREGVVISTATIGLLKEVYDQYYGTGFDPLDLIADFAGIYLGGAL